MTPIFSDNGEQALEIAEQLIRSSAIDIIVIDSVAALTPKYRSIELQCVTTCRCFRITEHDANLFTKLVDKDTSRTCFADCTGQFTQSL